MSKDKIAWALAVAGVAAFLAGIWTDAPLQVRLLGTGIVFGVAAYVMMMAHLMGRK